MPTKLLFLSSILFLASCTIGPDGSYVFGRGERVKEVTSQAYSEDCGECHFAFQPGLLPERSWRIMMEPAELEEHFGEFVEFEEPRRQELLAYIVADSAEKSLTSLSEKILSSIPQGESPLRITETNFYTRKHEDIPAKEAVLENEKVKSFANCEVCHEGGAEKGIYVEVDEIPGFGAYEHGH